MKLHQAWKKRLAILSIGATLTFAGGILCNQVPTYAATSTTTKANQIISLGEKYLGTPYKFGAKVGQTKSFDCSSFTKYIYGKYGISLPRTAAQQSKAGSYVSKNNWKKGDLLFFKVPGRSASIGHVGIYLGNNKMLNTYGAGGVKITTINSYWKSKYVTARRVIK